jgi:preprotein translocase subunit SecE
MAAENTVSVNNSSWSGGFLAELMHARAYKPMLGRMARQATCLAIWIAFALLAWRWYDTKFGLAWLQLDPKDAQFAMREGLVNTLRYVLPGLLLLVGLWVGYRTVNFPRFADFLIAVEAEMNKVTWPSQGELTRSSLVVMLLLASFTVLLFVFDTLWYALFKYGLGIR